MILEGMVSSTDSGGSVHFAPMGCTAGPDMNTFLLRPYKTSQTFRNLKAVPEGVFHLTDDVLLLAKAAVGRLRETPAHVPAKLVRGFVMTSACRTYEFRVLRVDETQDRAVFHAETLSMDRLRDFSGFNRGKHAVLEAAILASRLAFLPREEILAEFKKLDAIVQKTGGDQEIAAMRFLSKYVQEDAA